MIVIRKAQQKDLSRIVALGRKQGKYHERLDVFSVRARNEERVYTKYIQKALHSAKEIVFVACDGDKIVGYAFAEIKKRFPLFKIQSVGHINDVYVLPQHRREGIARQFLRKLFVWFRSKNLHYAQLSFLEKNVLAANAWKKYGFKVFKMTARKKIS